MTPLPASPALGTLTENARRFDSLRLLNDLLSDTRAKVEALNLELGLDRVLSMHRTSDSSVLIEEYVCADCKMNWLAIDLIPCPACHPIRFSPHNALRSAQSPPWLVIEEMAQTVADLHYWAGRLRTRGVEENLRRNYAGEPLVPLDAGMFREARELDTLAEILETHGKGCAWVPLNQANLYCDRSYLLVNLGADGKPTGRPQLCHYDPVAGWAAEPLNGTTETSFERTQVDAAVFILADHP